MYLTRNQAYVFKRTEGSNPSLSANYENPAARWGFFLYFYSSAVGLSCLRVNVSFANCGFAELIFVGVLCEWSVRSQ